MSNPNDPNSFDPNQPSSPFKNHNPYAAPVSHGAAGYSPGGPAGRSLGPGNMVRQVPVIGGLMIAQGALVCLMGGGAVIGSFFIREMMMNGPGGPGGPGGMPAQQAGMFQAGYLIVGLILFTIGALSVYSGIRLFSYQGRTLAIVSLALGVLPSITCYCAPTAIGLAIYGLIILLNGQTTLAFQLRKDGMQKDVMLRNFY